MKARRLIKTCGLPIAARHHYQLEWLHSHSLPPAAVGRLPTMLRPLLALCLLLLAGPAWAGSRVSFQEEVVPLLTRLGCNSGACHGKPSGKNGFALSLRGYNPALDIAS